MRTVLVTLGGLLFLSACTSNTSATGEAIAVRSGDDVCEIAATQAPSGTVQFSVQNTGSQVTEFYVLAQDGLQILSEVENIGPGLSRDLVVQLPPGTVIVGQPRQCPECAAEAEEGKRHPARTWYVFAHSNQKYCSPKHRRAWYRRTRKARSSNEPCSTQQVSHLRWFCRRVGRVALKLWEFGCRCLRLGSGKSDFYC